MTVTRTETDSFGPLEVPSDKYWGAQTQRSLKNFPIGWEKQPVAVVRALGVIKQACAEANKASGKLPGEIADAMIQAASEVVAGQLDDQERLDAQPHGEAQGRDLALLHLLKRLRRHQPVHRLACILWLGVIVNLSLFSPAKRSTPGWYFLVPKKRIFCYSFIQDFVAFYHKHNAQKVLLPYPFFIKSQFLTLP